MSCLSCCCKFCVLPVFALLGILIGLLSIPPVFYAIEKHDGEHRSYGSMILTAVGFEMMGYCSPIVQSTMSYSSVSPKKRTCSSLSFGRQHGWGEPGMEDSLVFGLRRQSSAAVKNVVYDPHLRRSIDIVIALNTTKIPQEVREMALPGIWPIVIQLNTDDPRRVKHRTFWAENLEALSELPDDALPTFLPPKGVRNTDFMNYHAIFAALAVTYFRQLFGTEVDWDPALIEEIRDDQMTFLGGGSGTGGIQYKNELVGKAMSLFMGNPAEILAEKRKRLEAQVFSTATAKSFIAEAERQGIADGEAELRHFMFGLIFAGLLGSPQMVEATILMISKDPKTYVPLFRANPDAFMLEAARFQVTVGGMLFIANKDQQFTIKGKVHHEREGDLGMTWNSGHNMDPAIFGGPSQDPEYAQKFIPGRENADRLMTWNAELRDVRKCKNAAGCPDAPRPCPGIHLARRVSRQVVEFFIGGFEEEMRQKKEL